MEWNMIFELIAPELLAVVAVCWIIGGVLKHTPKVPDWSIVYIVTGFAIGLTICLIDTTVQAVIQGILCGAFAIYGHQVVKQTAKARKDGEE